MTGNVPSQLTAARPKAWLAWSSGKDSAWALHTVRCSGEFEVIALLTTVNRTHARVAMHAVRESLLEIQAASAGLPLVKVPIPSPCSNEVYEQALGEAMSLARVAGVGTSSLATCSLRIFELTAKSNSPVVGWCRCSRCGGGTHGNWPKI